MHCRACFSIDNKSENLIYITYNISHFVDKFYILLESVLSWCVNVPVCRHLTGRCCLVRGRGGVVRSDNVTCFKSQYFISVTDSEDSQIIRHLQIVQSSNWTIVDACQTSENLHNNLLTRSEQSSRYLSPDKVGLLKDK